MITSLHLCTVRETKTYISLKFEKKLKYFLHTSSRHDRISPPLHNTESSTKYLCNKWITMRRIQIKLFF